MSLYFEAARFLEDKSKSGSLQSRIFNYNKDPKNKKSQLKSNPKQIFALVYSTLKYKKILVEVIKSSKILKEEKTLTLSLALLLSHDLLCTKSGRINCGKVALKDNFLKHKTRLKAELTRFKLKHKVRDIQELIEEDETPVRWFRVNTILSNVEEVLKSLSTLEKVDTIEEIKPGKLYHDIHVPFLFGIHPSERITSSFIYKTGKIIIQDRASCFPATILCPKPGDKVIDTCSAPGNKTTHAASFLKNMPNSIYAFERDPERAKILEKMVKKAGADRSIMINTRDFLATDPLDKKYEKITGFIVDPSCSGSGIFGRAHEDDHNENDNENEHENEKETDQKDIYRLHKLSEFQYKIVKHALSYPAARKLVYSTCSIHAIENEKVVIKLLQDPEVQKQGWSVAPKDTVLPKWERRGWPEVFQEAGYDEVMAKKLADGCVRTLPKIDGGIGFFAVCFERTLNGSKFEDSKEELVKDQKEAHNDSEDSEVEDDEWTGFTD
ncbi:S-adenosyl-L-methionine-dependent methyltransferase [Nadsonia fulvescens var. elongata DSM 6958]|uniref:S-adenosyl-L-methionine-dependent methyltransferase n=1 Tax=Nadsonia fulvescens var. elongata DSM 6958 TaxID=857566 RepID=A0A1E3PF80_9ASCO|nr:S-adenosyl-L-methionine-dependent methyltransferase [Nadsonia fulvescens var. elongata DSM 6958]